MQSVRIVMLAVVGLMLLGVHSEAQSLAQLGDLLEDLVEIPAVSGHEGQLAKAIAERLRERELEPEIDRMSVRFDVDQVFAFEVMDFESDIQTSRLGSGIGVDAQAAPSFVEELTRFDGMVRDEVMAEAPDSPRWNDGAEVVQLGVPILFYQTPVEVLDLKDLRFAVQFLRVLVIGGQS